MKCRSGFRQIGNRCVSAVRSAFSHSSEQKRAVDTAIRFFIIPTMLISFVFMFLSGLERAGFLYFAICLYSLFFFSRKEYQDDLYGAKFNLMALIGIPIAFLFLIISAISPAFSLLTPTISLAVDISFRTFVILAIAPLAEENFRSATFGLLGRWYPNLKFWQKNIFQGFLFAILHVSAYGIFLNAYSSLIQLLGGTLAIGGSLIAAFIFAEISGVMMEKFSNINPSILSHSLINFWTIKAGLIVVG